MACKTVEARDHLSGNVDVASQLPPDRISEEIKPGFFYRVQSIAKADGNPNQVIGVYAKSVKYCGDRSITKGKVFEAIRDYVFAQKREKNYLGVCFFGIWSYLRKGKNMCRAVQVPVKNCNKESDVFACRIWKTGHTPDEVIIDEEKRKFEHVSCKGDHTEERAINFLLNRQTQNELWTNFLEQTKQRTKIPQKKDFRLYWISFLLKVGCL